METKSDYNFIKKIGQLSDDGICVYDLDTRKFVYANDHFLKIFGIAYENLWQDAALILKIIVAEDTPYLLSRFNELTSTGCINTTEFRLKFHDNTIKHLSCDVMILENSSLVTAFVKDVSMAKRHEDYMVKYLAQKDTMLDMLTHNLSGPLQMSKDLLLSVQKGYNENNHVNVSRLIGMMQENTQHCIDIVNDFLRKEHTESSRTYVRKTRFDVMEKINITLDKLREMNKDKTFTLTSELTSLNINSDVVKFFQIIHNILSNAIKFTGENALIDINVTETEHFYTICISDNGIGIPGSLRSLIFREKVTGQTGLKGETSLGLGLFIVQKLVHVMGGEIWFMSNENAGAAFYVKLPKE